MARADILISMVKSALVNDSLSFRKSVEALATEERLKNHRILADRLIDLLNSQNSIQAKPAFVQNGAKDLLFEITPERQLSDLIISEENLCICNEFIEEQHRTDLLRSYGITPRNRLLFVGPPGNGKTTLAEAIAYELLAPLLVIRYDNLIGSYLGETASRLQKVFDVARTRKCVLFLDEFETLGKERGDTRETGEIKRVVSSLLLQIDRLPEHTVVITASNHPELLDSAVWRRFQVKLELKSPTKQQIISYLELFERRASFSLKRSHSELADKLRGSNYAEIQDFCTDILRQSILQHKFDDPREIVSKRLKSWIGRYIQKP
jgi:AAA+ superfamily predicted ATPase